LASVAGAGATSDAEARRQLMEDSQRLLEAFSNAAVAGNDNSSRAGVVTDLLFDGSSGVPRLTGAKTTALLLEKSRVVAHAKGEGSFHVLHQLLDAEDNSLIEELQLQGLEVEDIPYLQNDPPSVGKYTTG
jgi:myosin heavy subunit